MKCSKVNMGQKRAVHFDHEENYITRVKIWMTAGVYFEMLKCRMLFVELYIIFCRISHPRFFARIIKLVSNLMCQRF